METQKSVPEHDYYNLERSEKFFRKADLIRAKLCRIYDVQDPETFLEEAEISPQSSSSSPVEEGRQGALQKLSIRLGGLRSVACRILNNNLFTNFMIAVIAVSAVQLMIQKDVTRNYPELENVFRAIDWLVTAVFLFEIALKWSENFRQFWSSPWNGFDVAVTILSVLPDIVGPFLVGENSQYMSYLQFLRPLRILRTIKVVPKLSLIRVTVLAVIRAVQNLIPCLYLMVVLMYILSVFAQPTFESYSECRSSNFTYCKSFEGVGESLNTLFLIFTMDVWSSLLIETWQVPEQNNITSSLFIIGWVFVGAFMIQSVILGTLSNTFREVRAELTKDIKQVEVRQKAEVFRAECWRRTGLCTEEEEDEEVEEEAESTSSRTTAEKDWETSFLKTMEVILDVEEDVTWTGESLVSFFEILELLQHDLGPMQQLAVQALLNLENSHAEGPVTA